MVLTLVISVDGLKVKKLDREFLFAKMPLINGLQEIQEFLGKNFISPEAKEFFGQATLVRMLTRPFFILTLNASENDLKNFYHLFTSVFFSYVEVCMDSLWLVKDNSCSTLYCYTAIFDQKKFDIVQNFRVSTNCIGEYEDVEFSSDELDMAVEIDNKLSKILNINMDNSTIEKIMHSDFRYGIENNRNYNNNNRIARAYFFLKSARNSQFILMKISLYVSTYECLFTTDASEIIHKMAERVACYYSEDHEERMEMFKFVKKVYNVRSRYFHGKDLDKDKTFEKVPEMLKKLDSITRVIFKKIILDDSETFLKNESDLENYFTLLILS